MVDEAVVRICKVPLGIPFTCKESLNADWLWRPCSLGFFVPSWLVGRKQCDLFGLREK